MIRGCVVMVLVACGGAKKSDGLDCKTVAAAIAATMTADDEATWAIPAKEVRETFATALTTRCTEDKWSVGARTCHANVKTREDNVTCGAELTPAQRNEAKRAVLELLAKHLKHEPAGGGAGAGSGGGWLDDDAKLAVTGIEPASGAVEGGTYVVIRGRRFLKDGPRNVKVYFGSRQGTVVRFQSDSELVVQAPGGKQGESVDVLLVFDPGGQLTMPAAFQFVERAP